MGILADAETVKVVRLRYVREEPMLLETSYVPTALCVGLEHEDLAANSLYTLLEQKYDLRLQRASQTFEVTLPNEYECSLFQINAGMPMMLLQGVTYAGHDLPVEFFKALYRGDRFKFSVESQRKDHTVQNTAPLVGIVLKA